MNLSDDLTHPADPAPLLRAMRHRRRRLRLVARTGIPIAAITLAVIALWHRPIPQPAEVAIVPPPAPARASVAMTREELLDSLKDETFALIQWPDGREQLLIRR